MTAPDNVRRLRPQQDAQADTEHGQHGQDRPPRRVTSWTADELMNTDFPQPRWAVPGLIPEGVTLLVGAPKIGKSWASLGLGLAIASGGTALGSIPVDPGPVLYLALEDTPRRLKNRMTKILAGTPAPATLTLATECAPLPDGGDAHIASWLDRNPDARMVVVDVFANVRGKPAPGASAYDADYAAVTRAKRLADRYGIALVLVHHVRKAAGDDFLSEVSGTNGIAGAADTVMVLKRARGQADATLHVTGRDVDESEKALSFAPDTGTWHLLDGPATDHTVGDTRATILAHLRSNSAAMPKAIAEATGIGYETAKRTCARMAEDNQLARGPTGRYTPPDSEGHPDGPGTVPAVPLSLDP